MGYIDSGKDVQIDEGAIVGYNSIQKTREKFDEVVHIGDGTIIKAGAIVYAGVTIGKNCFIGHNTIIRENTIIGDNTNISHLVVIEGSVKIGSGCAIHPQCYIPEYTEIGNNVFMAAFCGMANDTEMVFQRPHLITTKFRGPKIEDNVRVGCGVLLGANIIIGKEAVIGMGAVVINDVASGTLVVGSPAKFMRFVDERTFIQK